MESADASQTDNPPVLGRLDVSPGRRVSGERHIRSVLVVELRVRADASEQVALADHDQVIGELTPETSRRASRHMRSAMAIAARSGAAGWSARPTTRLGRVASDGVLVDAEAQLRELREDPAAAPPRILLRSTASCCHPRPGCLRSDQRVPPEAPALETPTLVTSHQWRGICCLREDAPRALALSGPRGPRSVRSAADASRWWAASWRPRSAWLRSPTPVACVTTKRSAEASASSRRPSRYPEERCGSTESARTWRRSSAATSASGIPEAPASSRPARSRTRFASTRAC
jgi:hypothetical protein